jgi:hypothetical protein
VPIKVSAVIFALGYDPGQNEIIVRGERRIEGEHPAACCDPKFELGLLG